MEKIYNLWLQIKCIIRFILGFKTNLKKPKEVLKYELKFSDFFIGSEINRDKWIEGHVWGDYHPSYLYQYYGKGPEFINVENNSLNLYAKYEPKKFYDNILNKEIIIPYGIGLVTSKEDFKYGYYEISCILPKGKFLWPAIWLTAKKTWPPEIDILEAYSGEKSDYSNIFNISNVKFQPNIHFGFVEDGTKSSYGAMNYPLSNNPTERSILFGLHWTEKFIKFYYDGYLIFQTKKEHILNYFNKQDVTMNIILNNAFDPKINEITEPSNFKINFVKYFKKYDTI